MSGSRQRHGPALAATLLWAMLLVAPSSALADRGGYVIRAFDTALTVGADAELLVEERIEVEFSEPRHGIYREIPVRYTDPRGFAYSLGVRVDGVTDEVGRAYQTKITWPGSRVRIRIGSPKRTVNGRVVYVIRYRAARALGHFAQHDELYWNATGHEWQAPIERASVTVRLPGSVSPAELELYGYAGRFGSREQPVEITLEGKDSIVYRTARPLGSLEGLTIVAAWPHGLVDFPGPVGRAFSFLADNVVLAAPLLACAGLFFLWRRRGRDPAGRGSIVVRYDAPPELSPAEIGTLVDERVDLRDITATLVDLAVRGFLRIHIAQESALFGLVDREVTEYERLPDPQNQTLLDHERRLLTGLFSSGGRVSENDLENSFYKHLPGIRGAIYARLVETGHFTADPKKVRTLIVLSGLLAGVVVVAAGVLYATTRGLVMPHALLVPLVAAALTFAVFAGFSPAMPRRTRRGVAMREWALGFEEFVGRVEAEKLERDRVQGVFESLLPYAMALGVAAAWARRFEGIYEGAGEAAAPAWFVGRQDSGPMSPAVLQRGLASALGRTGSQMTSMPRSSGSSGAGGGGFSGGGGGGGGGGSW